VIKTSCKITRCIFNLIIKERRSSRQGKDIFEVIDPSKYSFDMLMRVTAQVFRLSSNFRLKNGRVIRGTGNRSNQKNCKEQRTFGFLPFKKNIFLPNWII
jgi:hypothetical protein